MGKIAVLFAGQGAQYPGMGKEFYENIQAVKDMFDKAEAIRPGTINDCFESTAEALSITSTTQPCLYLTDLACYKALKVNGISADVFAGFSLGEVAAISASEILESDDAFKLVCHRGEAMQNAAQKNKGGMIAVLREPRKRVEELCLEYGVYPVNYNCPGQIAVSGEAEKIEAFKAYLEEQKVRFVPIAVSGPFHTPYMASATESVKGMLEGLDISAPKVSVYSNKAANLYGDDKEEIIEKLSSQISNSVRWEDILKAMYEAGVDTFIECGPGKTLSGFVKRTLKDVTICNVSDIASLEVTISKLKECN